MVDRRVYPTDLSDAEWVVLAQLVPPPRPGGRPPEHPRRELIDALAYWLRAYLRLGGCCRTTFLRTRRSLGRDSRRPAGSRTHRSGP